MDNGDFADMIDMAAFYRDELHVLADLLKEDTCSDLNDFEIDQSAERDLYTAFRMIEAASNILNNLEIREKEKYTPKIVLSNDNKGN